MRVFKFGGASVNSAEAVSNMASIVARQLESGPLAVVVSAMGKTTNLLERLVPGVTPPDEQADLWAQLTDYHCDIVRRLLPGDPSAEADVRRLVAELRDVCNGLVPSDLQYNFNYDQVVSYGELISTTIVARYLQSRGVDAHWLDARQLIVTDNHFREGRVCWEPTRSRVRQAVGDVLGSARRSLVLTQGFIAGSGDGHTTTLGREGSDYSAAVLAYCLDAESVTIWKDVPGFLNADPKYFPDTVRIEQIPYNEAIELAYYGASVIHPKTVKPLQNKAIPLYIRSFVTPDSEGSVIGNFRSIRPESPLYIVKSNQILLSIAPHDFSFIAEDNLQTIFTMLSELGIRVNLMQNSALSFSLCVDNHPHRVGLLIERLRHSFHVRFNEGLQLVTIRYYTQEVIDRIVGGRPVLLEQRSRTTEQLVVPDSENAG